MKLSILIAITAACTGVAILFGGVASANQYAITPPGTMTTLDLNNFVQFVPLGGGDVVVGSNNPVIGDHIGQHPGAFLIGQPTSGSFFVGVFGSPIDTSVSNASVYLWETTSSSGYFAGPQIQVGYWDGSTFSAYGITQTASYAPTGTLGDPQAGLPMWINCSITHLTDFGINSGFPHVLNAVRIEATPTGHDQVTALAVPVVPLPSSALLGGTSLVCLFGGDWLRRKFHAKKTR
ncbi:MAG: hypothetical protein WCI73_15905, partial [Phycisphaerae bacterium]